jgi:hypothetical protein
VDFASVSPFEGSCLKIKGLYVLQICIVVLFLSSSLSSSIVFLTSVP